MTWTARLFETYENNAQAVGQFETIPQRGAVALMPPFHMESTAHIEVHLTLQGDFISARVVDEDDASTVIPCTEKSATGRTSSAIAPHPLFDNLTYVAGDLSQYCSFSNHDAYQQYLAQLRAWCQSEDAHPKVQAVLTYLEGGTLLTDLIQHHILTLDAHQQLITKWTKDLGKKPALFKVLANNQEQEKAFVRFAVDVPGEPENRLWRDASVQESFVRYYGLLQANSANRDLCFVTGQRLPIANKHGAGIRNNGDRAKLISSQDDKGLTFRGRFKNAQDVVTLSNEASQKIHNVLKWLIRRQGVTLGNRTFLIWGTDHVQAPDPLQDSWDLYAFANPSSASPLAGDATHQAFAQQIARALQGFRYRADYHSAVSVMILDAATRGRLAIVYYHELPRDIFLDRIQAWHTSCCWEQTRYFKKDNKKCDKVRFWGAPSVHAIAQAAQDESSEKTVAERLLPCIIDGQPLPRDLVQLVVQRASNPVALESCEWDITLGVACAFINKIYYQGGLSVALDETLTHRDYLFGRLLAIADVLEHSAMSDQKPRPSNAMRYMNLFARYPARTWAIIQAALQPYQMKLGGRAIYYNRLIDTVGDLIKPEDFTNRPLSELYLLGFYSQRHDLYTPKSLATDQDKDSSNTPTTLQEANTHDPIDA